MRRAVALALALVAVWARPAAAWDSAWDERDAGVVDRTPDPAPFVIPDGFYLVTDVYAGDVVTDAGDTTVYGTSTVADTPGTFARVIDVVGTGAQSPFDGASFNGRGSMSDGRAVAGTYYEDFVLTSSGFVSVNIVFFQDDSETRARGATPQPTPATAVPSSPPAPTPATTFTAPPSSSLMTAAGATSIPRPTSAPTIVRDQPAPHVVTAGIALGATSPVLSRIEVLRGRTVQLYPRAFVDGAPVTVRSWRLIDGVVTGTCAGSGTTATCDAAWTTLAPAGEAWTLRFELITAADVAVAAIEVVVRSPALGE